MLKYSLVAAATAVAFPAAAQTSSHVVTTNFDAAGGTKNGVDSFLSAGPILAKEVSNTIAGIQQSVASQLAVGRADTGTSRVVVWTVCATNMPVNLQTVATVPYVAAPWQFSPVTVMAGLR